MTNKAAAREALTYALTVQLHNAGTHSRFIDGIVLETGFQLDEAAAPLVALASYVERTGDVAFLAKHRDALRELQDRIVQVGAAPAPGQISILQGITKGDKVVAKVTDQIIDGLRVAE